MSTDLMAEAAALEARATELAATRSSNPFCPIYREACDLRTQARFRRRMAAGERVHASQFVPFASLMGAPEPPATSSAGEPAPGSNPVGVTPQPPHDSKACTAAAGAPIRVPTEAEQVDAIVARILAADGPPTSNDADPEIAAVAARIAAAGFDDDTEIDSIAARVAAA